MKKGHYNIQTSKLGKALNQYLGKLEKLLEVRWGSDKTASIIKKAKEHYSEIMTEIPFFNTPMYDSLILTCSRMLALKKAMKDEGIGVTDFVVFCIENERAISNRMPAVLRKIGGRIFLSKPVGFLLKRVARSCTANGWPTELIDGRRSDDFNRKIITRDCGMVGFIRSVGEGDLIPYCTFFDFTMAEAMGIGLKQLSSIDTGECVYCFYQKGKVEWPESIRSLLGEY
jgi:hypothetical protein